MIYQELTMRGFTVTDHEDLRSGFEDEVGELVRAGTVRNLHTVLEGFQRIPEASRRCSPVATVVASSSPSRRPGPPVMRSARSWPAPPYPACCHRSAAQG